MKRIFTLLTAFLVIVNVSAQAPQKMSYQAVIRDAGNALVANHSIGIRISILQGISAVYVETQTATTNANGLVTVEIGGGKVVSGSFSTINWANGTYSIKTETDPLGGSNYSITGTSKLLSVPYALFSANAPQGAQGPAGPQGLTGATGPAGAAGAKGATGSNGLTGPAGPIGPTGTTGPAGILTPGSAAGNTPYWNGTAWITNSSNIFNNGGAVGIGTSTPGFLLNFANALGDKISLYGNTGNHYGLGVQNALFQIHSDAAAANIAFGYGSSASFNERMRIINAGGDGLVLNGRMTLRNGTIPLDVNYGSGIWMNKADNSAALGFMGVQNNQNMGFYGGPGGWGFTYNALNSRVGIGNNNPNAPLAFAASLGKKITLYPGATGDVGFGVAGNRLQIYSDNPNADVAIGYDAAGVFNERFAVKPNGAIAVMGNAGTAGQTLTSNGAGNAASWASPTNQLFNNIYGFEMSNNIILTSGTNAFYLPGLDQNIVLNQTSKVILSMHGSGLNFGCLACPDVALAFSIEMNNNAIYAKEALSINGTYKSFDFDSGIRIFTLGPGNYNFKMKVWRSTAGADVQLTSGGPYGSRMEIIVVPQ
ncbi:MAG: hypothetical protein Q7U54_20560 [Bacteroidales bacterium]|nr:hypothetical protein [Bacteroidales bacterium]